MSEPNPRLDLAKAIAVEAGRHTLRYFQQENFVVERKSDDSPVTVADREAEQILRDRISANFPEDAILGEEFGAVDGKSGFRWILDPIDGTKSFISGVPLYGTLIGVESEKGCQIGVIYIPGLDECVYAEKGRGAWYVKDNEKPVRAKVSSRERLSDSVFVTSQVDSFQQRGAGEVYRQLEDAAYVTRTWGDCYGYLLCATGRIDVMVDPIMNVWDAAALLPIMEEAGGTFTDWQGQPTIHSGEGIATNGRTLDEVLAITRRFPKTA